MQTVTYNDRNEISHQQNVGAQIIKNLYYSFKSSSHNTIEIIVS